MSVIKRGITYQGRAVENLDIDGKEVKEVWYGDDKLVYYKGDGSQGLTYERAYDDTQKEKIFRQFSTSSKLGFGIESGVIVYPARFSFIVTDKTGTVISIQSAKVTASSSPRFSNPQINGNTITFEVYATAPNVSVTAGIHVKYTVRKNINSITLAVTGITEVETPLSPLNIPEHTFEFNDQNKIGTVIAIKDAALKDSTKISGAVSFPDTLKRIGTDAFLNCTGITQVTINANMKEIGYAAFACCPNLTKVFWYATNCTEAGSNTYPIFGSYPDIGTTGMQDTAIKNIVIGNEVQTLPAHAFCKCKSLSNITIPDNVTAVGDALLEFSGITSANIGNGLQTINPYMFSNCDKLQDVTLGGSVTQISAYAFQNCSSIRGLVIRGNLSTIQENAFLGAVKKRDGIREEIKIYLMSGSLSDWCEVEGVSNLMNPNDDPSSEIVTYKFFGSDMMTELRNLYLPTAATEIKNSTFINSTGLRTVVMSSSKVTSIGSNAFAGCSSLQTVTLSNTLTSIGRFAFYMCKSLHSLTLPDSLRTIGDYAFLGSGLKTLTIPENGVEITIPQGMVQNCKQLETLDLPSKTARLSRAFFYGATNLNQINYPGSTAQWNQIPKDLGWSDSITGHSTITVVCNNGTVKINPNIIT